MKIYLASRYSRLPEMQVRRRELEALGHTVTSRWLNGEHQGSDEDLTSRVTEAAGFALDDYDDLLAADCVISFTEAPRSPHSRGGRHVEFGMAIALDKRLIVVGYRENIFHCLPTVEFYGGWVHVLALLTDVGRAA